MKHAISQQGKTIAQDILVVGSGIAGLCYGLRVAQLDPSLSITILSKTQANESSSIYAQGGNAAATKEDIKQHITDTFIAGDGLCEQDAVEQLINFGVAGIHYLIENGLSFDKENGDFHLVKEGGHSQRRIYHVGDHTGKAIIEALLEKVNQTPTITILDNHSAINLITEPQSHFPGKYPNVRGCYVLDNEREVIHTFIAKVVVLATGGAGKVYRYTSNPDVASGDGVAMAYRAGARIGNMEFYQFHPTLLYHNEATNFLITEALRGEGGYLRSPGTGERFMKKYAPEAMELATRDIVSRSIFSEIEMNDFDYVELDVTHLAPALLQKRFPTIFETLMKLGIDIRKQGIPVVPAAHYLCGGVLASTEGETDLGNLFAIGEVAWTGLHGANRLASNSLLEGVVMGLKAAAKTAKEIKAIPLFEDRISEWDSKSVTDYRRASQINAHWRGLRGEMTSYAGIIRTAAGLEDLLKLILLRQEMIEDYYWNYSIDRDLIELRNILLVAEMITRSALLRKESRGGHYREDFPERLVESHPLVLQRIN